MRVLCDGWYVVSVLCYGWYVVKFYAICSKWWEFNVMGGIW